MARTPSTMKFHRQSEKRRLVNRSRKSMIRTFTKKAVAAAEAGDHDAAAKFQKVVQGLVDRASKGSTLHKNTAARRKARLAKRLNASKAGEASA
ncbi:MAG: 30S ribosomal protein S20 [Trueperaceae bacterium]|nr:MAG: 30S ribosomal protein S20 [Trueperaceae bacterium]